jgi:hypothetical protein
MAEALAEQAKSTNDKLDALLLRFTSLEPWM